MNSGKNGSCLFAISECDGGLLVLCCTVTLEEVYVNVFDGDLIPLSYKNLRCFFSSLLVLVFLLSLNRDCTTHSCFKCKTLELANISQCYESNAATPVIHPGSGRYRR